MTSRDTGRWVVPKGWCARGLADSEAALREAFEEAGVRGTITGEPIGAYVYAKPDAAPPGRLRVAVFAMEVTEELEHWPEEHQRRRHWAAIGDAARLVREPRLRKLIAGLDDRARHA